MKQIKVGIISPNDKRPWCVIANTKSILEKENELARILEENGFEVVRSQKETAWKTGLVRAQVKRLLANRIDVILIHQGDWTFPTRTLEICTEVKRLKKRGPEIIMFSYQDGKVPGLVAGMAARGALLRIGENIKHVFGKPSDRETQKKLIEVLSNPHRKFIKQLVRQKLPQQKYLALGGMSLDMTTTTADIDQWRMLFGISYAHLDQIWIDRKADQMIRWQGEVGESDYQICDQRVKKAVNNILSKNNFSFAKDREKLEKKIVLQIASYYAIKDLLAEEEATFGGIKCQDEESSLRCTQCLAAAYLNNNTGPDGEKKEIIPFACENDMDSALTQLFMFLITGKPAGFGDFRDIDCQNRLVIVNCGQHPPYYFGEMPEHLEQEHFYLKGGASVRGRTPAGKTMTVARLGRIGLKYILVATVIKTERANIKDHRKYNLSWPIIFGKLPPGLNGEKMINIWPCNHLGFVEGDITAQLLALAEELKIGYRIIDQQGVEQYKNTA